MGASCTAAAPLTALRKRSPKKITWIHAVMNAFTRLKTAFTTSPVLHHHTSSQKAIRGCDRHLESTLWGCHSDKPKKHHVAYYSKKPTLKEQKHNTGNWELLAVKLKLEEYKHWLKHAAQPFMIHNDHKKLKYLCTAKHLNPRVATRAWPSAA